MTEKSSKLLDQIYTLVGPGLMSGMPNLARSVKSGVSLGESYQLKTPPDLETNQLNTPDHLKIDLSFTPQTTQIYQ